MSHLQRNQSEPIDQLFQGILSLDTVDECYTFFSDLFTVQELTAFAQRFQVAGLLLDGNTYEMVRNQVPVSSSTITRINTELRYGSGGYQLVLNRLKELQENKKLIQDAERLVKKVPAAAKIKASDEEKLTEALEKVQELQARSLPINEKLEKNLQESKAAFDEGMQKSEELRNLISQLDENHMDKDMAALYEQAQDMFDADKKLFQRFTTKDEQNILKNCKKALKKNQSAAQKVEKQIEKLDPDNVTTKTAKTVQKAWDAYWKLTDEQRTFVDSLLYEKLEQCYSNLP